MTVSKCLRSALLLVALFSALYFSPGCTKKTYVTYINKDTTIIRDTTIIVDSTFDKQIQFYIPVNESNHSTTPYLTPYARLYKFNKHNYIGVDSIVFMANPNVLGGDASNYSIVTLYDVTDSVPIAGGTLSNNVNGYGTFVQTGNLYNALPDKEITLGMTIASKKDKTGSSTEDVQVSAAYLFLFRK